MKRGIQCHLASITLELSRRKLDLRPWSRYRNINATTIISELSFNSVIENLIIICETVAHKSTCIETDILKQELLFLLKMISENLEQYDPLLKFKPELVGSAEEHTRCVPDEFDFQLMFLKLSEYFNTSYNRLTYEGKVTPKPELHGREEYQNSNILNSLKRNPFLFDNFVFYKILLRLLDDDLNVSTLVRQLQANGYPVEAIRFGVGRSFLMMTILRRKQPFKIKVDLVPCFPFKDDIHLPEHALLEMPSDPTFYITIKSEYAKSTFNMSFARLENCIIKTMPEKVRLGYKLSKAVRNCHLITPVIAKLKDLGVVFDLEELIPSYVLKTCLLWLTEGGIPKQSQKSYIDWCISIYYKLYRFVKVQGEVPHFFHRKTGNIDLTRSLIDCKPRKDKTKLVCCRRQTAIILVVERILDVLHKFNA